MNFTIHGLQESKLLLMSLLLLGTVVGPTLICILLSPLLFEGFLEMECQSTMD